MCPVLFKGSHSLLLLACCYVTYRWSYAYLYRRYLVVWYPCCTSRMGTALFVRLSVCGSIYVYRCRALLVIGCMCIYTYNLAVWYMGTSHWPFRALHFGIFCHIFTQGTSRHIIGTILVIFKICHLLTNPGPFLNERVMIAAFLI